MPRSTPRQRTARSGRAGGKKLVADDQQCDRADTEGKDDSAGVREADCRASTRRSKKSPLPPGTPKSFGSWVIAIVIAAPALNPSRIVSLMKLTSEESSQQPRDEADCGE